MAISNETKYVCPHCLDTGYVELPRRSRGRITLLGHGDECPLVSCKCRSTIDLFGAHRQFFKPTDDSERDAHWSYQTAVYPCRFCQVGRRFADWAHTAIRTSSDCGTFVGGRRDIVPNADELFQIGAGVRWMQANPYIPAPRVERAGVDLQMPETRPLSEAQVHARKRELAGQAELLGASK